MNKPNNKTSLATKPNAKEFRKFEREKIKLMGDKIDKYFSSLFNLAKELSVVMEGAMIRTPFGTWNFNPTPTDSYTFSYKMEKSNKKKK